MRTELDLSKEEAEEIGFKEVIYPATEENAEQITFQIECINGYFYLNKSSGYYRWYQVIKIGEFANYIHLNIPDRPTLFTLLQVFQVKFKIVIK